MYMDEVEKLTRRTPDGKNPWVLKSAVRELLFPEETDLSLTYNDDANYLRDNFPECNAANFPELFDPILQACARPTTNLLTDSRAKTIIERYSKLFR